MKKRLLVGNWKSYPATLPEAKKIFTRMKAKLSKVSGVDFRLAVPYPYVYALTEGKKKGRILVGTQDVSHATGGAHTGEVAASMGASVGASFAIVGHSERRAQGETNDIVNKKVLAALGSGMDVVLCIGEKERDLEGAYFTFLKQELDSAFQGILPKDLSKIIIAYEPVFAIGKSAAEAMNGSDVQQMVIFIRKFLTERFNRSRADSTPILYGGSVDETNAKSIYSEGAIDGFLLGRASLDPAVVSTIVKLTSHS